MNIKVMRNGSSHMMSTALQYAGRIMAAYRFSTFIRNIILSLLLTFSLQLNPFHAEAGRTIRVGVYEAGLLANFDKDGSAHGFFVDMLNSIAGKEQWNIQYVPGSWQEGLDRLKRDDIDMVLCIGYTAEREKYMDFPKEYLLLNWGVLYRPKGSQITSLLELDGKSVSALKGDVYLTGFLELVKQFNIHVKIQQLDKYSNVFKAVESGAVAAGVAGNLYGILNEDGRRAEQTPVIFSPVKVGYAVNDGKNGDLIAALDRNIAEMKADKASIYHQKLEKLLGKKGVKIPREAYWILIGVTTALLLSVVFILLLRRQVKSKTAHLLVEIDQRKKSEEALLSLKDELHKQNEALKMNELELRSQNDHLLATEEMLRVHIDDYKVSQKRLKMSETKFVELLDNTKIQLWAFDGTSYTYTNKEWYDFTGQNQDSPLTAERWISALHPEDVKISGEVWLKNWNSKTEHDNYFRLRRHDGVYRDFYCHAVPITDEHGEFRYFQGFNLDITERKQAENELLESKDLIEAVVENVPLMIFLKEAKDLRFVLFNRAGEEFVGYDRNEILGKNVLDFLPPDEAAHFIAKDREVLNIESSFLNIPEESIMTVNKGLRLFHTRKVCIRGSDGVAKYVLGLSEDITDRKHAEAERKSLEHQFHQAQKLESLGVLAGGIAHDFNNILTVIMGHCYMAREDMIPKHEFKSAFQKIETAGNRAKELCRQMLTYAGKSPMEQTQFNLWLLVDEVVKMLQAAIKKNVIIELDLKHDIPEINGDTGQIQQIVMNFIINSAEAIGEVNGTIMVALIKMVFEGDETESDTFGTVIKSGEYVCLEVTDTGCGMDEATQKQIFEPFFTTKSTGRGLGMSAIHGIIKSHGGSLQLTSKPGVGTTFKVFFPIPPISNYADTDLKVTVLTEDAGGTILFVEDEELLRVMGKELLDAHGFTIMTASNDSEALEIYRERGSEIDVILLDLIMPVMGGIEAYQELRRLNTTVPIIICSGYGVESIEDVIANDSNAGFMHKPYNPGELRNMLLRMMK